jgi:hypothetical protein
MFKNSVLKPNVDTVKWFKAAGVRAIKTMAQTAVAMITVGATMSEIDWVNIASISLATGIASILTSIAGIPEVTEE